MRCLVTGATGYVGGRLVPRLLAAGHSVRCLVRDPRKLRDVAWANRVEICAGDVAADTGVAAALDGVEVAYYLIHSMGRPDFEEIDRHSAENFARAAGAAGLPRLVYLSGPAPHGAGSAHLRSRAEVADILLAGPAPATVLRAAVIIGSGSASFEMLRYLTENLPAMVTPRWVRNRVQPIAIRDVLHYLVGCARPDAFPAEVSRAFDIGGPEVLTYAEMMQRYAAVAGLSRRLIIPVRPLTPSLSAHWVGLVTPVPNAVARPLVASLIHEAVSHEHDIARYVADPPQGLTDFDTSVKLALRRVRDADVETRWSNATWLGAPTAQLPADPLPSDPDWSGGTVYSDDRSQPVTVPAATLWRVVEAIGGVHGWYSFPLAWVVRGALDRMVGGVGLRRGRRDPRRLQVGEALDFWRVEEIIPGELLRLRAEMRLPGQAWLEMRVRPDGPGRSHYDQRAIFLPRGLAGHVYWGLVWPFHAFVFGGMAQHIAHAAEQAARPTDDGPGGAAGGAAGDQPMSTAASGTTVDST